MKLVFDESGKRFFETGVQEVAMFPQIANGTYPKGYAWNGVTSISESPEGGEANPYYADNMKYFSIMSAEEFGGTIEAYYYPDEFMPCMGLEKIADGTYINMQSKQSCGLAYKTKLGNDIVGSDFGFKLHLVYGVKVNPSESSYETESDSPEPSAMSWDFDSTPVTVTGKKATSVCTIDSTKVAPAKMKLLLDAIYGTEALDGKLLTPDAVAAIIGTTAG